MDSESQLVAYDRPETSTSYNNISSYGIPYYYHPEESEGKNTKIRGHNYIYARYLSIKRKGFRLKKVYSTRARGRSGPIQSLARKLGRFKVRAVVAVATANGESDQKRWFLYFD